MGQNLARELRGRILKDIISIPPKDILINIVRGLIVQCSAAKDVKPPARVMEATLERLKDMLDGQEVSLKCSTR